MEVLLSFVQYGAIFLLLAAVSILGTVAGIIWKKKNAGASTKEKESSAEDSKKEQ